MGNPGNTALHLHREGEPSAGCVVIEISKGLVARIEVAANKRQHGRTRFSLQRFGKRWRQADRAHVLADTCNAPAVARLDQ